MPSKPGTTVVFYDGVCGLCDRLVRFLLTRDTHSRFQFAPLQSDVAHVALARHGLDASNLNTVYVVADWKEPCERAVARSRAVLYALTQLDGFWRFLGRLALIVPRPLADFVYGVVARRRYRLFGQFDACPIPPPEWRDRFIGQRGLE
jgi:predicted DCC family thiol-disulfide oxidoreductase YuxK